MSHGDFVAITVIAAFCSIMQLWHDHKIYRELEAIADRLASIEDWIWEDDDPDPADETDEDETTNVVNLPARQVA